MFNIGIIKLGAKGDVVRTLSLLPALKKKYPESKISWITEKKCNEIFFFNPYVDGVLNPNEKVNENFDILYCLDLEKAASDVAENLQATKKLGFHLKDGYPIEFNFGAQHYVNTFFDDFLKKSNKKTVQEMMFMAAELEYNQDFCPIFSNENEKKYGKLFVETNNIDKNKLVGIHLGASSRWPSRFWTDTKLIEFIRMLSKTGFEIILFGSPRKKEKLDNLVRICSLEGMKVFYNNVYNTDREFFSLINMCKVMVTSDSFAMHASLALRKPTVTLFFCTSPDEIEGYGLLKKIVSAKLYEFFPERMDAYSEELMESISPEEVLKAVKELTE